MTDKTSKLDQLKLLGAQRRAKSSGGGVESRHKRRLDGRVAEAEVRSPENRTLHREGFGPAGEFPERALVVGSTTKPAAGVAPGPSEAKKKRSPRGTFDRTAYQKEYMRLRRQAEKREAGK